MYTKKKRQKYSYYMQITVCQGYRLLVNVNSKICKLNNK